MGSYACCTNEITSSFEFVLAVFHVCYGLENDKLFLDSVSASDVCYYKINSYGNYIGNCGMNKKREFFPCEKE